MFSEVGPFVGQSMVCLGVELDSAGSMQTEVAHRPKEVEKRWGRWRHASASSRIPLRERVLHETIVSIFVLGSQLRVPSRRAHDLLRCGDFGESHGRPRRGTPASRNGANANVAHTGPRSEELGLDLSNSNSPKIGRIRARIDRNRADSTRT